MTQGIIYGLLFYKIRSYMQLVYLREEIIVSIRTSNCCFQIVNQIMASIIVVPATYMKQKKTGLIVHVTTDHVNYYVNVEKSQESTFAILKNTQWFSRE